MSAKLLFGTGNSVTFGSVNGGGTGFSKGFSKSSLSNLKVGDLLVAWLGGQSTNSNAVTTAPAGWIRYGAASGSPSWGTSRNSGLWYYALANQSAIDTLPGTITWTFSESDTRGGFVVARAIGVDLTGPEDSAASSFSGISGKTSFAIDGIVTVSPNTLLVGGVYRHNSAGSTVPTCTSFMTGYEEYNSTPTATPTVASTSAILGYSVLTVAGTTGPYTATFDSIGSAFGGELVAFKALGGGDGGQDADGAPYIAGSPVTYATGQLVNSFTVGKPTGVQDGDALILALSAQSGTATTDFASSGWTRISQPFVANSAGFRIIAFYAMPVPTAADVSQTDFTFASTGGAGRVVAEMFIVRGAELSYLTDGYSYYGIGTQTVTLQQPATSVANNLMLAGFNAQFVANIDYTVAAGPVGMVQQIFVPSSTTANVSKTILAVYNQVLTQVGPVPSISLTWNGTNAQSSGVTVAIRPLGSAPTNDGLDIHFTSAEDTLSSGKMFYTSDTDTLSTPREVRPVPTGYSSVTAMLASTPFYVAHRGGSLDWPEMSLHAYTQSVFWGAGALELSLARTSDGVWFGLHDMYLDRTSLGQSAGTTLQASTMTWAQVQSYQIEYPSISNPASLPQPYMRWEEIIATYYPSHVLFIDPKYAAGYTGELLAMMDALPGTPTDHFVAKSFGQTGNLANTTGWPYEASSHGYQTWGYFYDTNYAIVPSYQGRFTILGMNYNASAQDWTQILSYGKPVMGHIVPSAVSSMTALAAGASGLMVSGVQEVISRTQNPSQA